MQAELSTWRPLWDFASVLFVLGLAGAMTSRDRSAWWCSQGLLLLSVVLAFAAASALHRHIDFFSLGIWVPLAWLATWLGAIRIPHPSISDQTHHD